MGGLFAFEMARRCSTAGQPIDLVVMFDTVAPGRQGAPPSESALLLSPPARPEARARAVRSATGAPGGQGGPPSESDLLLSFAADLADRLGLGISAELVEAVHSVDTETGRARLRGEAPRRGPGRPAEPAERRHAGGAGPGLAPPVGEARRHGLPLGLDGARHLFRLF